MPLPPSDAPREHIHTRQIEMTGWRRADGQWEVEGHLTDRKTYSFDNSWRGTIHAGEAIHDMWVRLTVSDDFVINNIVAVTDAAPFGLCPSITENFQRLKGLKIGHGWMKDVKDRVGGTEGCTHLVELLGPMATTLFQTVIPFRVKEGGAQPEAGPSGGKSRRPPLLGTCHAFAETSPVVEKLWPSFYRPATATATGRSRRAPANDGEDGAD